MSDHVFCLAYYVDGKEIGNVDVAPGVAPFVGDFINLERAHYYFPDQHEENPDYEGKYVVESREWRVRELPGRTTTFLCLHLVKWTVKKLNKV